MKRAVLVLLLIAGLFPLRAWEVTSPDHAQTFTFGSERHREWVQRGNHLAVMMHFTNDPYVDRVEPRQYDDFWFNFPSIVRHGGLFYYQPPGRHRLVPVARAHPGLFGTSIELLPSSLLVVSKPHGYLTVTLVVGGSPRVEN